MRRTRISLLLVLGMLAALLPMGAVAPAAATTGDLLISGVVDGPLPGGLPKAIELYVVNDIADLSIYGVGSANNGNGGGDEEFSLPADSATAGDFIHVATEAPSFNTFFGFDPDYTDSVASINGDDAIELFRNGSVVDVFGDVNTDGTSQPWEYLDGWAYRVDGTGRDGMTFVLTNWTFSGPNALDGETSNAAAGTPFPIGSYVAIDFPPSVSSTSPTDGELDVALDADIEITFSEDVAVTDSWYTISCDGSPVTASASSGPASVFTLDPDVNFGNGQACSVTLITANIVDQDGTPNNLDGDSSWSFETAPDVAPTVVSTVPADGDTDVGLDSNIEITFSEAVTVTDGWFGISCNGVAVDAVADSGPSVFTLDPVAEFGNDETCTVTLTAANIVDQDGDPDSLGADYSWSFMTPTSAVTITKIHDVQGDGFESPLLTPPASPLVTIEGVVVGDFQADDGFPTAEYDNNLGGYHVQEEDADADSDPLTSEGVFVRDNDNPVAVGDVVRVSGTVAESSGLTRIQSVTSVEIVAPTEPFTVTPATVELPFDDNLDFESVEGMSVRLPQALYISEYFNFDRFGEIVLSSNRAMQPTAVFAPGSTDAIDLANENVHSRITLDDGRTNSNPDPAIHPNGGVFGVPNGGGYLTNLFRGGSTVQGLPGVMDYAFGAYRIQPTTGGTYADTNPRQATPDAVGGDVTVATFNVLNYFTTLDDSGPICGPLGGQGCRGADNPLEFERQRTKIINAISAVDADVVGLMEIENDSADVAVADLVAGLNTATAPGRYDYVATGPVGPDVIRVALIYQPASVTPYGAHAELAGAFLDPNSTGSAKNRAALAQSFVDNANGGVFTVAVNHLKSKGSPCGAGDDDPEQGSCNVTRTLAAEMLADWFQSDPTNSGDADFLIIGDLNSYDKEDPIVELAARGYADLIRRDVGEYAYSYLFSAQLGYLDYIMANGAVAPQVTDTTVWHINADEPDILDYDTRFNPVAMYEPNAFRSSDHDPVIVGLELTVTPMQAKEHSIRVLSALLPTGNRNNDKRITKAIESIEDSLNPAYWVDDFHLTDRGKKVFDEEKKAVKDLVRVHGSVEPDVDAVIAALVKADEELAGTAIDDAAAAGGSQRYIDKALKEMKEALKDLDRNKPDKAIDHYKKAWQYAQKALAEAPVRFATFNASLNRFNDGDLAAELSVPGSAQPATIAEIIQRNRPDVVLINEFDYDADGVAAEFFQDNYLSMPQNGASPIVYPYRYVAPSNTGVPSGFDLDNSGSVGGPNDAFGFGFFEGQFAFVVYSMYPIDSGKVRTFQNFLWKDMPGALLPEYEDGTPWFTDEELDVVRLSSKNHIDVPISVDGDTIHFLVSHPTPPVFDGPEDRNGKRNYDEIRFWADYVGGGNSGKYIYDDAGKKGGLSNNALFVIAGDQNADPFDGDSYPGAAQLLLDHPRINEKMTPSSLGGTEQDGLQGGINDDHLGDPAFDTADFSDSAPGNLRVDYVLPRKNMKIMASGVFWPETTDPLFPLVGTFPFPSSDHRLVWIDLDL